MNDTIAAIATPVGISAIGIIRISGDEAIEITDKCFAAKNGKRLVDAKSHTVHLGKIQNENGEIIDECLITVFKAPHSYTGENSVEISLHGNPMILRDTLSVLLNLGARQALAGEFTKRAFINGKLDLSQAEAVIDLINSQSRTEAQLSLSHLDGKTGEGITKIRNDLLELNASIMAYIDFSYEDLSDVSNDEILDTVKNAIRECERLSESYNTGRVLKDGIKCAIVGKPNAGKSSLMNLFAGYNKSIVTDVPGTTRDMLEETVITDGIKLRIYDTAGIRETADRVERIGVERTKDIIEQSELVLCVFDGSSEIDVYDKKIIEITKGMNRIALINKSDLEDKIDKQYIREEFKQTVEISAVTGEGFSQLKNILKEMFIKDEYNSGIDIIMSARQQDCLNKALKSLNMAVETVENGFPPDVAGIEISEAISALGEITGQTVSEQTVNEIFSRFCVGK